MIIKSGNLSKTKIDINNIKYKIDDNNLIKVMKLIYKKILDWGIISKPIKILDGQILLRQKLYEM